MKNQFTKSSQIGLSFLVGMLGTAHAIERPNQADTKAPRAEIIPEGDQIVDEGAAKKPLAVKQSFLGVSGDPVSEDLAWHLNLENGLQLNFVLEDSPADLAGLTERDIVTSIDGKKLSSQDDLRAAVQAKAPGEEVTLKLVRRGRPIEQKIKLAERAALPPQTHRLNPFPADRGHVDLQGMLDRQLGNGLGNIPSLDIQRQLLKEVEKSWGLNGGNGPQQLKLKLDDLFDQKIGVKAAGSIMFQDQEGSVEMRMTDGAREIVIRDINGEVVFKGAYDSEVEKSAVPEEYRERVEKLGLDKQDGRTFHFEFNHKKKAE